MAKDKERTVNPAAAQRKLEKQKALKKGKAAVTAQRNERLATRNPHRLEAQIAELHALKESQGGKLGGREARHLEDLEKDAARIKKAREALGDRAPKFAASTTRHDGRDGERNHENRRNDRMNDRTNGYDGLGKRRRQDRGDDDDQSEGSISAETDEDVRKIPWPRDTPPPLPRRDHRHDRRKAGDGNANMEPLGQNRHLPDPQSQSQSRPDTSLPAKPSAITPGPARTTYESKPQVRNLRAEATKAFVPAAVKRKIDAVRGQGPAGSLLEEEDLQNLENQGYRLGSHKLNSHGDGDPNAVVADEKVSQEMDDDQINSELNAWERDIDQGIIQQGHGNVETIEVEKNQARNTDSKPKNALQAMIADASDEDDD